MKTKLYIAGRSQSLFPMRRPHRSAGLQPAVSRIFNPQVLEGIQRCKMFSVLPNAIRRYSRLKICATTFGLALFVLAAFSTQAATTNDLAAMLRNGLFEEQVNHDMNAAIATYQSLVTQFDKDRLLTATAVFRLGECYRTIGKTNEAAAQYQRVVREFADQTTLVTLSRQNLTGMGVIKVVTEGSTSPTTAADSEQVSQLYSQLTEIEKLRDNPEKQARIVQATFPDDGLKLMLLQLPKLQEQVGTFRNKLPDKLGIAYAIQANVSAELLGLEPLRQGSGGFGLPEAEDELKKQLQFITDRVDFILGLQKERYAMLRDMAVGSSAKGSSSDPVLDEEGQEIRRIQTMIQNSPDLINAVSGGDRTTPLIRAAKSGQLRVAQYLLDNNADVNLQTPLVSAAVAGHKAMVELLLHHGANEDSRNRALQTAAFYGFKAVAEVLIENKTDVNFRSSDGSTVLYSAAGQGRTALIELLIAKGASVNVTNNSGVTPLSLAAKKDLSSVKALLAAKADPNGGTGDLPLHTAESGNDAAIVEALLQAGADANRSAKYSEINSSPTVTPLWLAVARDKIDFVKLLLAAKADPNGKDENGLPIILAAWYRPEILKALLDAGADANVFDKNGQTPLALAAGNINYNSSVNALLAHGADKEAGFPLIQATARHHLTAAEALLKAGANVNVRFSSKNQTPLHVAAEKNDLEMTTLLLAYKADPNLRDSDGNTPLVFAKANRPPQVSTTDLIDLLRKHGALDKVPMFDRIQVTRPSANFSQTVFSKGTNDWNRFTLLETILNFYQSSHERLMRIFPPQPGVRQTVELQFPDLSHVTILRHKPGSTNETRIAVNLLNSTNGVDCSKDVPLQFGDVVEIPEREHALSEQPIGLSPAQESTIRPCLLGDVQLVTRAQKIQLTVFPDSSSRIGVRLNNEDARRALLSSSDLAHVKVTRRDPATGKTREWILDCSNPQSSPDLWLRKGDVIEVPEK